MARIPFERMSFALVDDNAHIRRLLRSILYSFGCRDIHEAEDGAAGLEVVELHQPDIIILDLMMPVFDGFDFVRAVRNPKSCELSQVPIIMLTGYAEKTNVIKARDLGVTEFMCKPFSADTLYKRVQSIVERPREFVTSKDYYGPALRTHQQTGELHSKHRYAQSDELVEVDEASKIEL